MFSRNIFAEFHLLGSLRRHWQAPNPIMPQAIIVPFERQPTMSGETCCLIRQHQHAKGFARCQAVQAAPRTEACPSWVEATTPTISARSTATPPTAARAASSRSLPAPAQAPALLLRPERRSEQPRKTVCEWHRDARGALSMSGTGLRFAQAGLALRSRKAAPLPIPFMGEVVNQAGTTAP